MTALFGRSLRDVDTDVVVRYPARGLDRFVD